MAVANCKRCGQMFHRTNRAICPDCVTEEDEAFQIVRAYLKQHREANMQQLVDETGVDEEFIIDMLHEGRLFLGDNPNFTYECERCGGPTQTGRYCASCTKELSGAFSFARDDIKQRRIAQQDKGPGYFSRG